MDPTIAPWSLQLNLALALLQGDDAPCLLGVVHGVLDIAWMPECLGAGEY